jgi:hypothetical protein
MALAAMIRFSSSEPVASADSGTEVGRAAATMYGFLPLMSSNNRQCLMEIVEALEELLTTEGVVVV